MLSLSAEHSYSYLPWCRRAGANGLPAIGERSAANRIAYSMPDVLGRDRARYAGKTVAVLGAGHSAIGTLIDLTQLARRGTEHATCCGCCAATIPPRRSAAAPTTSWSRAARWARRSLALVSEGKIGIERPVPRLPHRHSMEPTSSSAQDDCDTAGHRR